MQTEAGAFRRMICGRFVAVMIEMVNAFGVDERGAALDAVDLVTLAQQVLG